MVYVSINIERRPLAEVDDNWLTNQIDRRRLAGHNPEVQVRIEDAEVDLLLSTPNCTSRAGGGRTYTPREAEIVDLWRRAGLCEERYTTAGLVHFLKELRRRVRIAA